MNAAKADDVPRLPPPAGRGNATPTLSEPPVVTLRGHVWLAARTLFRRDSAQQFCWLWLLGSDGRVHALRVPARRIGDAHFARSLLARLARDPDQPIPADRAFGPAFPLPGAPIVPLPRWNVSWGHPLQQSLRAFAAQLDGGILAALGELEVPGPFFGSVGSYNRLARLPATIRRHRLQALAEFPPLVAPLLLDVYGRPDLFGTDEDEPQQVAAYAPDASATVLDAMDRGRDLIGALAAHYRICRALVRAPTLREPWTQGRVPRDVLQLLNTLPVHARPRSRAAVEDRLPLLRALPLQLRGCADIARLANTFAQGWDAMWRSLDGHAADPLVPHLRDTRDFLRAALDDPVTMRAALLIDMERLCLAWLARRGPASLLDASLRWHGQPLVTDGPADDLPETLDPIRGEAPIDDVIASRDWGTAHEILSRNDLIAEGETMYHCVGTYWSRCVLDGVRIVHLMLNDGEAATAQYQLVWVPDNPTLEFQELRGPHNAEPSGRMREFARMTRVALNVAALRAQRVDALQTAEAARARQRRHARPVVLRPLDRRSRQELRLVLAWCAKQAHWCAPVPVVLRGVIAGFAHGEGPSLLPQLAPGDDLQLVREPDNPHDARAVRIDWHGHKLGYVPRADNADVAQQLDADEALAATIRTVALAADAWDPVEFEITTL